MYVKKKIVFEEDKFEFENLKRQTLSRKKKRKERKEETKWRKLLNIDQKIPGMVIIREIETSKFHTSRSLSIHENEREIS